MAYSEIVPFIAERCALCARSLVSCSLFLPAGAVDRTDSIGSRSSIVVESLGSEDLGFWGNAKDKLVVAKMATDAAHVIFRKVMEYLDLDHVRFRAMNAGNRIAALGITACRVIGKAIGEEPERIYAAMRQLGVVTAETVAEYYADGDVTLQQWLKQFDISLTASCRFGNIFDHYNIKHSAGAVRSRDQIMRNVLDGFAAEIQGSAQALQNWLHRGAALCLRPQGPIAAALLKGLCAKGLHSSVANAFVDAMEIKIVCHRNLEALRQHVPLVARRFERFLSLVLDRAVLRNYVTGIITELFDALIFAAEGGEQKQVPRVGLFGRFVELRK